MNDSIREQIIAEIAAMTQDDPVAEDEFTVSQFVEQTGILRRTAATRLELLVEGGELTKRQAKIGGARCNVYRKA